MRYRLESIGTGMLATLQGGLNHMSTLGFEKMLRELETLSPTQMTVDLSEVTVLDSMGVDQLILLREAVHASSLILQNPNPFHKELLEITHTDVVFDIK